MALSLYYILLGIYGVFLAISLVYYLTRKAPGGDASVGWAMGILYTAALAGIVVVAWFLSNWPSVGLVVLSFPLIFLALPRLRRARTALYTRFPAFPNTPPLTLFLENSTNSMLHVQLECWFATANSHSAVLYTTFDYYLDPLEKSSFPLTPHQTRLMAHKSKYVTISVYERVEETYEGGSYLKEIQPCMQHSEEKPEAFRSGEYRVVVAGK